jgi:hypothetical protein
MLTSTFELLDFSSFFNTSKYNIHIIHKEQAYINDAIIYSGDDWIFLDNRLLHALPLHAQYPQLRELFYQKFSELFFTDRYYNL